MKVTHITAERREEWNAFVAKEPSFALLQSWGWGEFKEKMGWKVFRIGAEKEGRIVAGVQMLIRPIPPGLTSIAYIPRGPVGDWLNEEVLSLLLTELHQVAHRYRAVFLRIEPPLLNNSTYATVLEKHHFHSSTYTNQPRATITLNLTPEIDEILAKMRDKTRYNIRYAAKKGVTVRVGDYDDLPTFYRLMRITSRRGGFSHQTLNYYRHEWETFARLGQIKLFVASYQGETVAANMSAVFGEHGAFLHGASSGEFANLQPNYLLMWEAMLWAKDQNCHTFDLWGIPDDVGLAVYQGKGLPKTDALDGLWGVYRFKRGFSQNVLFYASTYDYIYSAPLYKLSENKYVGISIFNRIYTLLDTLKNMR